MSKAQGREKLDLSMLAKRLVVEGMPVQTVIASEAGVSQSTVSRAIHGQIKGPSIGARKLWEYAAERMAVLGVQQVGESAKRTSSQRAAKLGRVNTIHQNGDKPRARRLRAAPPPRRRSEDEEASISLADRNRLAKAAIAGLQDYLADAFDPLLLIEQLALLRRAQDPGRRQGRDDTNAAAD